MPKRSIREDLLARRRHCSVETCLGLSLEIQAKFVDSELFRNAASLALYSAVHNEVLTEEIARQAAALGKTLLYPRVAAAGLEFVAVASVDQLRPGTFGVLEPQGADVRPVAEVDVLIVPGVAFDLRGHRLGYGKGYYDRALSSSLERTVRVGLAYDFQVLDVLPIDEHDQTISVVMTESRTVWFTP